ncbi:MAG: hypothetical protein MOP51_2604, partial [Citricoccus sp.]|nr:hypothetical protein [Citricoccus sp. WCRC_4]
PLTEVTTSQSNPPSSASAVASGAPSRGGPISISGTWTTSAPADVTYLALTASVLVTYVLLWALKRTIDPLVYTYAILAGGVAIGASVDLASPLQSWLIGLLGGAASTLCFVYLHDWLCRKTGVLDTMGVHNLHGVPGILGGLVPLVLFAAPLDQLWAVLGTLVIGLVTGLVAGLILRLFPPPERMLDDAEAFPLDEVRAAEAQ